MESVKFMSNWEEYVRTVEPYVPGEQPNQPDMIKLNTNENPYPPAPGVVEALKNFDTDKLRLYPEPTCKVLVDAIAIIMESGAVRYLPVSVLMMCLP